MTIKIIQGDIEIEVEHLWEDEFQVRYTQWTGEGFESWSSAHNSRTLKEQFWPRLMEAM